VKKINNNFLFYFFIGIFILSTFFVLSNQASAFTDITEDILYDTEWIIENSPYVIRNDISISAGTVLTINPGVVVKFDPIGFNTIDVFGDLVVNGEPGNEVYFTSFYDDSIGGDTNEDYSCYPEWDENGNPIEDVCYSMFDPLVDDWYGIYFNSSSNSVIKNALFKYASEAIVLQYSYINLNNIKILDSNNGITLIESTADADGIDCIDSKNTCLSIFNNSTLNLVNSNISTIYSSNISVSNYSNLNISYSKIINSSEKYHNAISIFNNSNLNISHSEIKNISGNLRNGIELFNDSSAVGEYLDFSNSTDNDMDYITIFNGSSFDLKNSSFVNCVSSYYACIAVFDGSDYIDNPSSLIIEKTIFNGGSSDGISIFGDSIIPVNIHHSQIINFKDFAINTFGNVPKNIDAKENFWGNETGPFHAEKNPTGTAGMVADNVEFIPFCKNEKCQSHNPVILIPGITGSYLYKNYDDFGEIWPNVGKMFTSLSDDYLDALAFNSSGTWNQKFPINVGDIIRGISNVHVFDYLINRLNENGYVENEDLFVFPYDWRFSTKETSEKLKQKIEDVISKTNQNQVDIVAHSMGGLVAKKYIVDFGDDKINKLIFLGTPQLGAPKAFKTLMFGDSMGFQKIFLGLSKEKAKFISQNMPSVYELLPSEKYISENGSYVVDALRKIVIPDGDFDLDYQMTKKLMIEKGRNPLMFPFSEELHSSIDDLNLSNISSYNFVGCGSPTIGKIEVTQERAWEKLFLGLKDDYNLTYINGDETVPLISANKTIGSNLFYVDKVDHGSIPTSESVINAIISIFNEKEVNLDEVIKDSSIDCGIDGNVVSTHSPVKLDIYDENGNHTGIKEDGNIEYGIEGVVYDILDEVDYAFLPKGENYRVVVRATNVGGFSFKIEEQVEEEILETYDWTLIPLKTLQTTGEIFVGTDYPAEEYKIKIDINNDGNTDNVYEKGFDGTEEAEKILNTNHKTPSSGSSLFLVIPPPVETQEKSNIVSPVFKSPITQKKFIEYNKDILISSNDKISNKTQNGNLLTASVLNVEKKNYVPWVLFFAVLLLFLVLAKKVKKM